MALPSFVRDRWPADSQVSARLAAVLGRARAVAAGQLQQHPWRTALALTWLAFAAVPVAAFALFVAFVVTSGAAALAGTAALAVLVVGGSVVFWAGLAAAVLVAALGVTTVLAALAFAWAAGTAVVAVRVAGLFGLDVVGWLQEWWTDSGASAALTAAATAAADGPTTPGLVSYPAKTAPFATSPAGFANGN